MEYCVWIFMAKLGQVQNMTRMEILGFIFILKIQSVDVSLKSLTGGKTSSLDVLSRIYKKIVRQFYFLNIF